MWYLASAGSFSHILCKHYLHTRSESSCAILSPRPTTKTTSPSSLRYSSPESAPRTCLRQDFFHFFIPSECRCTQCTYYLHKKVVIKISVQALFQIIKNRPNEKNRIMFKCPPLFPAVSNIGIYPLAVKMGNQTGSLLIAEKNLLTVDASMNHRVCAKNRCAYE